MTYLVAILFRFFDEEGKLTSGPNISPLAHNWFALVTTHL